jgi:hypothetical protein
LGADHGRQHEEDGFLDRDATDLFTCAGGFVDRPRAAVQRHFVAGGEISRDRQRDQCDRLPPGLHDVRREQPLPDDDWQEPYEFEEQIGQAFHGIYTNNNRN